jgi:hypothetical protein
MVYVDSLQNIYRWQDGKYFKNSEQIVDLKEIFLFRKEGEKQCEGEILTSTNELIAKTIELPNKYNIRNISCIPYGNYLVILQKPKDTRPYYYFRLPFVRNRSGILIHIANYVSQLRGCIAVGSRFKDINNDGELDLVESTKKLDWLVSNLPEMFLLTIKKSI